ncbi:MAG: ribosomal protein S18-alanine N-acetyltransferase [Anaerorhabdus sp.]
MTMKDIAEIVILEKELFSLPWRAEDFERELQKNQFAHYFVAIKEGEIVGYGGVWNLYEQAQITTIGVTRRHQRLGIATQLLETMERESIKNECETCALEVRVSNLSAQALYDKFGYIKINVRKGYYSDNHEDAFLMMKTLGGNYE